MSETLSSAVDLWLVSSVDSDAGFWVDHTEPLKALLRTRERKDWPLGELHDGHEFLLIIEVGRRTRSRPRPKSRPKDTTQPPSFGVVSIDKDFYFCSIKRGWV